MLNINRGQYCEESNCVGRYKVHTFMTAWASVIIECHTVLLLACNLACNYIESVTYLMMHVNNAQFRKRAQSLSFRICFNKTIRSSHAPNLVSRLRSWSQKIWSRWYLFYSFVPSPEKKKHKKTGRLLIDMTSIHACWQLHVRLICLKSLKLQFHC